jgi:hypothetical protein
MADRSVQAGQVFAASVVEHVLGAIAASAALGGHAGVKLKCVERHGAILDGGGDVAVGNAAADTNDHDAAPCNCVDAAILN